MYPFEYLYRIIKKDDVLYVFIDNVNRNIDTATIKDIICNKISGQTGVDKDSLKIKLYISGHLVSGVEEINDKSMIFGLSEYSGTEDNKFTYKLVDDASSSKHMLRVYYKDGVVSITNYSLLEDSLGIKLNYKSEGASQLAKVEQYVAEQQSIDSNASEEEVMLPPVLSGDKLVCQHGGEVVLLSIDGQPFCNNSDTFILDSDLRNAKIMGCTNNVAGAAKPCTSITIIPPTALSKETFNDKRAVMRDHLHSILTDNMASLMLKQPEEPNLWEILSHKPVVNNGEAEGTLSELIPGIFFLRYNTISSGKVSIINTTFENISNATYANTFSVDTLSVDRPLNIELSNPEESDSTIDSNILNEFKAKNSNAVDYIYKALTVIVDNNIYEYILVIPNGNKSLLKKIPKEYRDFGYGKIINLSYMRTRTVNSSNNNQHNVGFSNVSTIFLLFPIGAKKMLLHISSESSMANETENANKKTNYTSSLNENKQTNYILAEYISEQDFSNEYSDKFNSYDLLYNAQTNEYTYQFIEKLVCNDNEKIESSQGVECSRSKDSSDTNKENDNDNDCDQDDEESLVQDLYKIISSNNINDILDKSIKAYKNFLNYLADENGISTNTSSNDTNENSKYYGGFKLDNLTKILEKAIDSRNQIYKDREKYKKELEDVCENLLLKLIARKLIELLKDNILPFATAKNKKEFVTQTLTKVKFLAKHFPVVGVIIIVYEIASAILDLIKRYKNAPQLMAEFSNVLSFYSNLDAELSTILSNNYQGRDVLYKKHYNDQYYLALYNSFQENTNHLILLCNNLQTKCNYVKVYIDQVFYEKNILLMPQPKADNKEIIVNTSNNIAQLSIFNSGIELKNSSYFHHVKDLIMKSNLFTMIESPIFSSIFISELIKHGFYSSLGEKLNKNIIIITDCMEKTNLAYKSQNYVFSKLLTDDNLPKIYTFRLMKEYKLSDFSAELKTSIEYLIENLVDGLKGIKRDIKADNLKTYKKDINNYLEAVFNVYLKHFGIQYNIYNQSKKKVRKNIYNQFHSKIYNYFNFTYASDIKNNLNEYTGTDLLNKFRIICARYSKHMIKVHKNNCKYLNILKKYENYDFSFLPALQNANNAIVRFHSLIETMFRVLGYFGEEVNDDEVKESVSTTISHLHKEIESFFKNSNGDKISSPLLRFILSDNDLCTICKNVVSAEYSYEYSKDKDILQKSIQSYATFNGQYKDYHNIQLRLYVDNLYETFTKISSLINKYSFENIVDNKKVLFVVTHDLYNIDENIFKDIFYSNLSSHMNNILPVKKGSIEYAADDIRYYDLLLESILVKYLNTLSKQKKNVYDSQLSECDIYLSSYMFVQTLNNMSFIKNIDEAKKYEYAKILRIAYLLISDDISKNIEAIKAEDIVTVQDNLSTNTFDNSIQDMVQINDKMDVIEKSIDIVSSSAERLLDDNNYYHDLLSGYLDGEDVTLATNGIQSIMDDLNKIIKIADDFSVENIFDVSMGKAFDVLTDDEVMRIYNDNPNTSRRPASIYLDNYGKYLTSCFKMDNLKSALKAIFSSQNMNVSFSMFLLQSSIDYTYNLFAEKFLKVPDLEEFEAKTNAIKYAYTSKRIESRGAVFNASKGIIALPIQITQNYLMSDFRAAVFGGASFDNDCFVRGTSAGIFIQDNNKISENFVYKICDYIYNVPLEKIDKTNAVYIEAYKKIVIYLYNFGYIDNHLKELYDNISSVSRNDYGKVVVASTDDVKQEKINQYNINPNGDKFFQPAYVDDFAIQLQRFGEYNYNYFYTHNESITEDMSTDKSTTLKNGAAKKDKIVPVLLGSLVYAKEWK